MSFQFVEELPASNAKNQLFQKFAEALRDNPGKWGVWPANLAVGSVYAYRGHINSGDGKFPKPLTTGEFRAEVRGKVLYVRYDTKES